MMELNGCDNGCSSKEYRDLPTTHFDQWHRSGKIIPTYKRAFISLVEKSQNQKIFSSTKKIKYSTSVSLVRISDRIKRVTEK